MKSCFSIYALIFVLCKLVFLERVLHLPYQISEGSVAPDQTNRKIEVICLERSYVKLKTKH